MAARDLAPITWEPGHSAQVTATENMGTEFKIKDWNVTMIPTTTGCKDSTPIKELADPYDMLAMIILLLKCNTPKRRPGVYSAKSCWVGETHAIERFCRAAAGQKRDPNPWHQ